MLNRTKRTLQKRCTEHALEARRLMGLGRGAEGLARYTGAVDMARRLAETDPDDPRPLGEYAAMLQSAGSLCAQAGQAAAALQSLSACEGIYRDLGDRWALDVRRQLAEVKARKTVTETGLSLGASAVLDADEAVTLYRGLLAEDDSAELALLTAALERDLPVLAICRGVQILNVAYGGDLEQHLPDHVGHEGHKEVPGVFSDHDVAIEPDTHLAALLGDRATIKSHHHQGLARVGEGLRPSARDEDGWVEALEAPDRRFAVGVLWHPEAGDDARLFEALVAEAAQYRALRRG